ncbi:hypothetical protein B0H14DRAFT_2863840, partial [Mycena olivaceomarginata]
MRLSVICPFLCGLFRATSSFPILPRAPRIPPHSEYRKMENGLDCRCITLARPSLFSSLMSLPPKHLAGVAYRDSL